MYIIKTILYGLLFSISPLAVADYYSMYPPQISDLSAQSDVVNQYNWRTDVANVHAPGGLAELPIPNLTKHNVMILTLKEAILLSLRNNPTIQSAELNRIIDKFALILAHNGFEPQYSLGGTARFLKGQRPIYSSAAGVTLKNTIGTQFGMTYNNTYTGGGGPGQTGFTVTQPILKGFGRTLNMIPWNNALDSENEARLNFKSSIIDQVTTVITSYRKLIEDYQSLDIQKRTLASNLETVRRSQLKVKVGQLAKSDLSQQQATYETTKLSMLTQQSSYISDYQSFLEALGLKADAKVKIVRALDYDRIKIPNLKRCIQLALKGNIPYQTSLIAIRATERAIIVAKDANRWTLDLVGAFNIFGTVAQPNFQTINGVVQNVTNTVPLGTPSLTLNLSIPLNNVAAEQGVISSQIKLQQAKLAIDAARLQLIRNITNQVQQIHNQLLTLKSAEHQVLFQRESYNAVKIKYKYGRTTTFEVNQIQNELLSQETTLVSDKIALLNQITTLNKDLGITLDKWGIKLRY